MKYEIKFTTQFKKDLKLAKKQGKDTEKLYEVIEKLANGEPLEEKYRDHYLSGDYKGCRECHIEPDWLLIYKIIDEIPYSNDDNKSRPLSDLIIHKINPAIERAPPIPCDIELTNSSPNLYLGKSILLANLLLSFLYSFITDIKSPKLLIHI